MKCIPTSHMLTMTLLFMLLMPSWCSAWQGKVIFVLDGDSIKVLHNGREEEVRLYGIDSPEKDQAYGQKARDLTRALVAGRKVEVQTKDVDSYGRTVGLVYVDGSNLNEQIVRNGYAWVYPHFCEESFCHQWSLFEAEARNQKKGMWNEPGIIPPWQWRHQNEQKTANKRPQDSAAGLRGADIADSSRSAPSNRTTNNHFNQAGPLNQKKAEFHCDGRVYCSQMRSCEEATFFLNNCPGTKMDGNNDGVPCEKQWCH